MKNQFIELNYTNFDDELKSSVVLVDFWAEWCHPCKLQQKLLLEISGDYEHLFKLARLNVDDNKSVSGKLGVRNIPTLILYRDGVELRRIIGLQNKETLINQITHTLSNKKIA